MNKTKARPRWLIAYMITATSFSFAPLVARSISAADALTRAGECSVNGRSMTLKNDGGWCWNVVAISAPRMGKRPVSLCHPMPSVSRLNRNMGKLLSLTLKMARLESRIDLQPGSLEMTNSHYTIRCERRTLPIW